MNKKRYWKKKLYEAQFIFNATGKGYYTRDLDQLCLRAFNVTGTVENYLWDIEEDE